MNGKQFLAMLARGELRAITPEEMCDTPEERLALQASRKVTPGKKVLPEDLRDWFNQSNQNGREIGEATSGN